MKKWTIKKKIIMLSVILISLLLIDGAIQSYEMDQVAKGAQNLGKVQMPAIRLMTLTDMMHDGLSSVVYEALHVSSTNDLDGKKSVAESLKAYSEDIKKYINELEQLPLDERIREAILAAKPELESYIKSAEDIAGTALVGSKDQAVLKLPDFKLSFTNLENKLEVLGDLISKNADQEVISGAEKHEKYKMSGYAIILLSLLLGGSISFLIVRDLMKTLGPVISNLVNSSQQVSLASSQSSSSATELSESSTEQAASLQQTMASIEQISAMVNQNAESANMVKEKVDANLEATDGGEKSVAHMLDAITEIKSTNDEILSQMESSNKEFGEIVKIISDIGEKTKVINDIVFQTKLLSFNASVEAARAGEHGKGFAVVAEEVGNLAQMSGNAARQITEMLTNSIQKVNEIVEQTTHRVDRLVEIGRDKISMGQSTAQQCREALEKIALNATSVASMVNEIAHASKEQAQGIQEINKAISQLDQVTQQNSAVAQAVSTQAEYLHKESQSLGEAVSTLADFVGQDTKATKKDAGKGSTSKGHRDNVVKLKPLSHNGKSEAAQKSEIKVAAGAEFTPSSSDKNFQDF